uniref:Cadherin domain-containing protein n=1 Tax=Periophthalmus magnuspinnatus TaxID=409849 RepID=A0A3B4BHJ7_9GOBI
MRNITRCAKRWWISFVFVVALWTIASAQLRYSITEEVAEGTIVGNVAKDLGLDKSALKDRKYRIVSGAAESLFHVDQKDGNLYVSRKIDREEVCEKSSTCLINLKTVLENPLEVHYVGVEVQDINDNAPFFPELETTLEISESALPGVRIPLKAARDLDSGIIASHYKCMVCVCLSCLYQNAFEHNDHLKTVFDYNDDVSPSLYKVLYLYVKCREK